MKYLLMPAPSSTDIPDGYLLKTDKSKDFTYLTKELDDFTMPSDAKIDLSKGYWQISAAKEDVEKTAFVTSDGTYDFLRLLFGMKNSGATLVRGIRNILAEMSNVDSYIDDLNPKKLKVFFWLVYSTLYCSGTTNFKRLYLAYH